MFHQIVTDIDEQGKPTGGFLIPSSVPVEDIERALKAIGIEPAYFVAKWVNGWPKRGER